MEFIFGSLIGMVTVGFGLIAGVLLGVWVDLKRIVMLRMDDMVSVVLDTNNDVTEVGIKRFENVVDVAITPESKEDKGEQ